MTHPLSSPRRATLARVVTLVAIVALASWYVVRAEGHADTAETAADTAEATAEALRVEVRARVLSDCEGTNEARQAITDAIVETIRAVGAYSSNPERVEVLAVQIKADLQEGLPIQDCEAVAAATIAAAEDAAEQKEPA